MLCACGKIMPRTNDISTVLRITFYCYDIKKNTRRIHLRARGRLKNHRILCLKHSCFCRNITVIIVVRNVLSKSRKFNLRCTYYLVYTVGIVKPFHAKKELKLRLKNVSHFKYRGNLLIAIFGLESSRDFEFF